MDTQSSRLYHDGAYLESQYWNMKNRKNNSYGSLECAACTTLECCRRMDIDAFIMSFNLDDLIIRDPHIQNNIFWTCRKYNMSMRYAIVVVQIFFILVAISLAIVIFYYRHNKVKKKNVLNLFIDHCYLSFIKSFFLFCFVYNKIIKHSMWILLELVLFGTILLYATVNNFEILNNSFFLLLTYKMYFKGHFTTF